MLVQKTLHLAYMKSTEYYKEFSSMSSFTNLLLDKGLVGGGGDFVITTDLSLNHPYGYLLFAYENQDGASIVCNISSFCIHSSNVIR